MSINIQPGLSFHPIEPKTFLYELDQTIPFSVSAVNDDDKSPNKFLQFSEKFFGFRKIAHLSDDGHHLTFEKVPWYKTLIKGAACATVILPVIFGIGKYINRSEQTPVRKYNLFLDPEAMENIEKKKNGGDSPFKNYSKEMLIYDTIFFSVLKEGTSYRLFEHGDGALYHAKPWISENAEHVGKTLFLIGTKTNDTLKQVKANHINIEERTNDIFKTLTTRKVDDIWYFRDSKRFILEEAPKAGG